MSLTENELHTRQKYDEKAEEWLNYSGGRDRAHFWNAELHDLWWHLPLGATVLEIGCGPATDGKFLKKAFLNPISFDYSRSMLKIAKGLNPEAKLLEMDANELAFEEDSFDGFWATASILHLEDPKGSLKEIHRVTKDGGAGFISVKEGEGEGIDPKTGYYFKYYTEESFAQILKDTGFEIIHKDRREGTPSHGWLTYLVKVNK